MARRFQEMDTPQLALQWAPPPDRAPLVLSYGLGVDSTALLVAMRQRGIRPDAILTADPGGELPEVLAYLPIINAWLESVGFPQVTVVRYEPVRAPYVTLEEKCLANETLPSLAFGKHSCSQVFKARPMNLYLESWPKALDAWSHGMKVVRIIGYNDSRQDRARRAKADTAVARKAEEGHRESFLYEYVYPLQEWGYDRAACEQLILDAGLPLPAKSSCFFCPAMKKSEVIRLRDVHPLLFQRGLAMERGARDGKHGLRTVVGLGRSWAWSDLEFATEVVDDDSELLRP